MEKDIQEILLTEEQIKTRIAELGKELTADYAGKDPIIVGVLKGVVVFYADMIREIKTHCEMDFMWISSYAGTNSTGKMEVKRDIASDIRGPPCADFGGYLRHRQFAGLHLPSSADAGACVPEDLHPAG